MLYYTRALLLVQLVLELQATAALEQNHQWAMLLFLKVVVQPMLATEVLALGGITAKAHMEKELSAKEMMVERVNL